MAFENVQIHSLRNGIAPINGYREDLAAADVMSLSLTDLTGVTGVKWLLVGRPEGSVAGGAGPEPITLAIATTASFTVDTDAGFHKDGTYTVHAIINPGTPSETTVSTILVRVTGIQVTGGRHLRKIGGLEAFEDTSVPATAQGYATMMNRWLELLRQVVVGGGVVETLNGAYDAGTLAVDQTMILDDGKGGGIIIDATGGGFTGQSALRINTPANGPITFDRATANVGIGIIAPTKALHIKRAAPTVRLEDTGGGGVVADIQNSAGTLSLLVGATALAIFPSTGGMRTDFGIGIGAPPPTAKAIVATGGSNAMPLSSAGQGKIQYNVDVNHWQFSENAGPWTNFGSGTGGAPTTPTYLTAHDETGTLPNSIHLSGHGAGFVTTDNTGAMAIDTNTYLTTAAAAATYLTIAGAAATYETQAHASATYLPLATAAATYLTIANAAATYLTIANAAATYQPILTSAAGANLTSKFIVQGTADAGLTNAQFLGALPSGLIKNASVTGVLSSATANTDFADPTAFYVVTKAANAPPNAIILGGGGFTTGVLQQTISGAVATLSSLNVATGRVPFGASGILATDGGFHITTSGGVFKGLTIGSTSATGTSNSGSLTINDRTGAGDLRPLLSISTLLNPNTSAPSAASWFNDLGGGAPFGQIYLTGSGGGPGGLPASVFVIEGTAVSSLIPADIYFRRDDHGGGSGGAFNISIIKNDGGWFWFNTSAAQSVAGQAGVRTNAGKLQYSENGGIWHNFTDLTGAGTTPTYLTRVDETGTLPNSFHLSGHGAGFVKTDNAGAVTIDTTAYLSGNVGPGAGTIGGAGSYIQSITLDVNGRVTAAAAATIFYQTVASAGTARTQRATLNFLNAANLTAVDNGGTGRTDVDLATTAVVAGAYTFMNATVDAYGRITAASNGSVASSTLTYITAANETASLPNSQHLSGHGVGFVKTDNAGTITVDTSTYLTTAAAAATYLTITTAAATYITTAYQTVQAATVSVTQRTRLNFLANFTAVDNAGNTSTDVDLANTAVAANAYGFANLTVDVKGRLTAASSAGTGVNGRVMYATGASSFGQDTTFQFDTVTKQLTASRVAISGTSGDSINGALFLTRAGDQAIEKTGGTFYLATTDANSIAFVTNGASRGNFDTAGNLNLAVNVIPTPNLTHTLGTSIAEWSALYVESIYGNTGGHVLTLHDETADNVHLSLQGGVGGVESKGFIYPMTTLTYDLGTSAKVWNNTYVRTIFGDTASAALTIQNSTADDSHFALSASGIVVKGTVTPAVTGVYDLGSSTKSWANIFGNTLTGHGGLTVDTSSGDAIYKAAGTESFRILGTTQNLKFPAGVLESATGAGTVAGNVSPASQGGLSLAKWLKVYDNGAVAGWMPIYQAS